MVSGITESSETNITDNDVKQCQIILNSLTHCNPSFESVTFQSCFFAIIPAFLHHFFHTKVTFHNFFQRSIIATFHYVNAFVDDTGVNISNNGNIIKINAR